MASKSSDLPPARLVLRDAGACSLVVRPDLVRLAFNARSDEADAGKAVAVLDLLTSAATAHGRARKPAIEVQFGAPHPLVRDPELHRAALIDRWLTRVRQLSDLAEASRVAGPLQLRECSAPGPVTQHPLALDGPLTADA